MGRFLLAALAAISVALGYLMENQLLLIAGAAFFVLALVVLIVLAAMRRTRRTPRPPGAAAPRTREDELRELGLSEPRPRGAAPAETPERRRPPAPPAEEAEEADDLDDGSPMALDYADAEDEDDEQAPPAPPLPDASRAETAPPAAALDKPARTAADAPREAAPAPPRDDARMLQASDDHPLWQTHSPTAFASFLRTLWAATEVQTALLAAAETDGTATLLAARSHLQNVRQEGRFPADSFLRVAQPDRPITVLAPGDPLLRDLPYYRGDALVGEVAVLPVTRPDGPALYLVADIPHDDSALTERQRALLLGFAELLRTLLAHPPETETPARAVPTRRAIVAEEMARARAEARPLALALVYHTEAEAIAAQGEGAVAEAERSLRLLLEDLVQHGRLERFGELMFGAFLHDDVPTLTRWSDRVHARTEEEGIPVAIGMARMGGQRDADALRADAANALAEALLSEDRFAMAGSA